MSDNNITTWPKIVLFGDSLTQQGFSSDGCWASLVADYVIRKCDVINRGFSGYNSRWCKLILPKILPASVAKETVLVTIFLGANDSVDSQKNQKQHVPVEEYKENLKEMIQYIMSVGISREKIVLIGPPACDEEKWEADCIAKGRVFGKFNEPTKHYSEGCRAVAMETGAKFIDIYSKMMKSPNFSTFLNDGLHLSVEGSQLLFSLLEPVLQAHTESLPLLYPYWNDIDNENPHVALDPFI